MTDAELEAKVATATMTAAKLREHWWKLPLEFRWILRHVQGLPKPERDQLIAEA